MKMKELVKKILGILFLICVPLLLLASPILSLLRSIEWTRREVGNSQPKEVYNNRLKSNFEILQEMSVNDIKKKFRDTFGRKS